jgi:hypothetical protein
VVVRVLCFAVKRIIIVLLGHGIICTDVIILMELSLSSTSDILTVRRRFVSKVQRGQHFCDTFAIKIGLKDGDALLLLVCNFASEGARDAHKAACTSCPLQNNIQVVYMYVRLTTNVVLKESLKEGHS